MDFVNKRELSDQQYHTNVNVSDVNHMGIFIYHEGLGVIKNISTVNVFMSTRLLKDNTNGFRVPKFKLAYIHKKTHPSH